MRKPFVIQIECAARRATFHFDDFCQCDPEEVTLRIEPSKPLAGHSLVMPPIVLHACDVNAKRGRATFEWDARVKRLPHGLYWLRFLAAGRTAGKVLARIGNESRVTGFERVADAQCGGAEGPDIGHHHLGPGGGSRMPRYRPAYDVPKDY